MRFFLIFLFTISSLVYGQSDIKGVVVDCISSQPIPFVTVYINGTTKGTITNEKGLFEIHNVPKPSEVIFSHISYDPKQVNIKTEDPQYLKVTLCAKKVNISEVVVNGNNRRNDNIYEFKKYFLGTDYWGIKAILENDEVLMFNYDGNSNKISNLKAYSTAPLIVDLPKLGYKLHIDLVDFDVEFSAIGARCTFLAYYYFQPYNLTDLRNEKKYEKNRLEAYNNSSQQFCRSIYNVNLEQDGYKLFEKSTDGVTNEYNFINIYSHLKLNGNNEMQIFGLKDKQFVVLYNPVNNDKYQESMIFFLKDTCIIRKNGTIPDNSIMFGGEISRKKVGSFLPDDYMPVEIDK